MDDGRSGASSRDAGLTRRAVAPTRALPSSTSDTTGRLTSLDGLRGLAALIVVIFHILIVMPPLADVLRRRHPEADWVAVLAYSPLRLFWAGQEAVTIFFVLSGFVLTLPFLSRRFDWLAYYPRRMIRLYIPVWAAVVLALVWYSAVPRRSSPGLSWWMNAHDTHLSWIRLAADTTLVFGTGWLNSPLWSLKWEVWFSLLLPLYLLTLVRWRRHLLIKVIAVLGMVQLGHSVSAAYELKYLATFAVGVLIAAQLDRLRELVQSARQSVVGLVLAVGAALLIGRWLIGDRMELGLASTIGAGILVTLFATWSPVMNFAQVRVLQWLGRISFSLYLVHEPVVVSVTLMLGTAAVLPILTVALPGSLVVAVVFYRLVEVPALHLSRKVGRMVQRLRRPGEAGMPASCSVQT